MQARKIAVTAAVTLLAAGCLRFQDETTHTASTVQADRTSDVALADVTGDGLADPLVLTNRELVRLEPCGAGCLLRREAIPVAAGSVMQAADLNGDDVADVVVGDTSESNRPRIYFGGAAAGTRPAGLTLTDSIEIDTTDTYGFQGRPVGLGDFNGDAIPDILFRAKDIYYRLGGGNGTFANGAAVASFPSPRAGAREVRVGDLDGNGDDEIIVDAVGVAIGSIHTLIAVYLGPAPIQLMDASIVLTSTGDLDGDGRDDLIVRPTDSLLRPLPEIRFLRSTGTGVAPFAAGRPLSTSGLDRLAVADLNNDGRADLVATNRTDRSLSWWNGAGNGAFAAPYGIERLWLTLDTAPTAIAVGDVDGDGRHDLLLANPLEPYALVTLLRNDSVVPA